MKFKPKDIIFHLILFAVSLTMLFPIFWMLLYSLKAYPESYASLLELIKAPTTLSNYTSALQADSFDLYFINSIIVAFGVTIGNVFFCMLTGYALARKKFIGKRMIFFTIMGVLIIPPHVIMIPLYRLMVEFGWLNTYYALILPWVITPFGVFLVRQYVLSVPYEIEDAARIDGASEWYILFKIVFPLCKPILIVLAIYIFLNNWNSFLFPFLFTNTEYVRTLPVGLTFYLGKQSIDWGRLMAGSAISALPVIILFLLFQKQIIKGLTAGALKE